jgi:O-acetyl-ADP-ribose deacetylase (regulator of RNase III)
MRDIELGLQDLVRVIRQYKIASVAVPPLGSGLGGLDWNEVRPRLEQALTLPDVRVFVFEPSGVRRDYQTTQFTPNMTAGKAVLIGLMRQYLASLLDPFVTLLEIHKLMYFLQTSGEPLHLAYRKQKYGPYAENLRHVLAAINGHFISGYVGDDSPFAHIELCPGAVDRAEQFLREHQETRERFNRVSSLVDGFESSFGLELLATVHWVIEQDGACTLSEAVQRTYDWNDRKKQFTPQQIEIAANTLADKGWIRKLQAHVAAD